jgi:hypothetical protein
MVCLPIPPLRLLEKDYLDFSAGAGFASFGAEFAGAAAGAAPLVEGAGLAGVASFTGAFSVGAAGGCAGFGVDAGAVAPDGTTDRLPDLLDRIVSASDVTMKMIAAAVVALESNVAAPRCPKAV